MNRLTTETSPYLRQHERNPVDWYPWGNEAISKARREKKPIFLSIGYSACHWCHVMERESFEDEATAAVLNEHFVSIKVDREERPDLDHIYMAAVQAMTHHGGWPLTVFLTPELQPFYGGTYFPKEERHGVPGFKKLLAGVAGAWKSKNEEVRRSAEELTEALKEMQKNDGEKQSSQVDAAKFKAAADRLIETYDAEFGGIGTAPKFFHSTDFRFLLRQHHAAPDPRYLEAVENTLGHWANGGIYDQLGGGFHRYSTDRQWVVPHFEKMLYDNALLVPLYLDAYQTSGRIEWARVARETLDYLQREMTAESGGYFATQDADTEGVEGKFFVWDLAEVQKTLDPQLFAIVSEVFSLTAGGNWEHKNILTRKALLSFVGKKLKLDEAWVEDNFALARMKLFETRMMRVAPPTDMKIVVSWNGLALSAFAQGYAVLGSEAYLQSAEKSADFLLQTLGQWEDGKLVGLHHTYKDTIAKIAGFLDDYAAFANGLLCLFECTWSTKWLDAAVTVTNLMVEKFWDQSAGAFYYSATEHTDLLTRVRDSQDGATPSGASLALTVLVRLTQLTGLETYRPLVEKGLSGFTAYFATHPSAVSQALSAALEWNGDHVQWITIASKAELENAKQNARDRLPVFRPDVSRWVIEESEAARLASKYPILSKKTLGDKPTRHFVCANFTCNAPTDSESVAATQAGYRG